MSQIQVPDHVAKSIEAERKSKNKTIETPTDDGGPKATENPAYVKESARVLDPYIIRKIIFRPYATTNWLENTYFTL